ncbi:hypothetical protein GNI_164000, partial [Gregarina niphandrodes]
SPRKHFATSAAIAFATGSEKAWEVSAWEVPAWE